MGDGQLWIVIPGWDEFQHRDVMRTKNVPPWIKAYTRLLSDDEYLDLSHHLRGVLLGLWLEYARSTRQLRDSTVALTRRLGQRVTRRDLESLNDAGFIAFSASKPASSLPADSQPRGEESRTPLPPAGKTARPRRRRTTAGQTHDQANPHVCGVNGCTVRDATESLIAEHRENVHGVTSTNGQLDNDDLAWLDAIAPDPEDNH